MTDVRARITAQLRMVLAANRLTIEQAARRANVADTTMGRILAGQNTSVETLARLADGLGYEMRIVFIRKPDDPHISG